MPIKNEATVWYEQGVIQEPLYEIMLRGLHMLKRIKICSY